MTTGTVGTYSSVNLATKKVTPLLFFPAYHPPRSDDCMCTINSETTLPERLFFNSAGLTALRGLLLSVKWNFFLFIREESAGSCGLNIPILGGTVFFFFLCLPLLAFFVGWGFLGGALWRFLKFFLSRTVFLLACCKSTDGLRNICLKIFKVLSFSS